MQVDLTQIILAIIALLGTVVTTFVIPLLREKLSEKQQETLNKLIDIGVYAADQLYNMEQTAEKKSYVQNLLIEKGYNVDLESIDAAIEATVKKLKIELKK